MYTTKQIIRTMFLDMVNNFMSPKEWDAVYGFDMVTGYRVLNLGRKIHYNLLGEQPW
jgi:hypothetical protein